ncbi:dethiobiotin synthase [Coxiella-like endosymbiont of Amblyomma americanum]|nr:dethiobiotin synthase [Coxiella-like endosymbiont of Amblyomma americanum]
MKIFVTGTDTGVGKTYISAALLRKFNNIGYSTFGIKPVASGCYYSTNSNELHNEDALTLQKISSIKTSYAFVNPISLKAPIAPNIAAQLEGLHLSTTVLIEKINKSLAVSSDVFIIEGIGGWAVPLNATESMADFVALLRIPVILIAGIKLGCLNHTILTAQAIKQKGVPFLGWVANCIEPYTEKVNENIETLIKWVKAPCIGVVHYKKDPIEQFSLQSILNFSKINM